MFDFRQTLIGIGAMLVGSAAFILNDTLVKIASEDLELGQVMLIRGLIASAIILALALRGRAFAGWRRHLSRPLATRTLGEVLGMVFYLIALFNMPIANSTAIMQSVPLMMTAAGAMFMGDVVGWRRWIAICAGFCGILIIVQPGAEGFNIFSLLALAAAASVTLRDLSTRAMAASMPTLFVTAVTTLIVTMVGGSIALIEAAGGTNFQPVSLKAFLCLAGSAASVLVAYTLIIVAMRHGETLTVAPFRYFQVLWAILAGWLVWDTVPQLPTLLGIAIVVASGVYMVHRERQRIRALRAGT
ncbi:DMT family transporter [Methylobrevis pamukkalensis]|uniref:Riboflavin transporter n=1 Tax=Methylobrevis pamukkalensis TaxID=1439726 RepID=A0A1E3H2J4_9HYPH|nr:DMT family transporter [Methylobrevis pamukkalensis]ODN70026.1 Riboflavin transporter [Methylobrevis pamukkalensis]